MLELVLILFSIIMSIALLNAFYQGTKKPDNTPSEYLKKKEKGNKSVIVFAGDSITHGRIGENYIKFVSRELNNSRFEFINAGINGQLTWNLLQRLDEIIACDPDVVTILIGTNDANDALTPKNRSRAIKRMNLPQEPDHAWFKSNLSKIIRQLKTKTDSFIAILSIPTIGEDLDSTECKQSRAYSITIKELAQKHGVEYLALHEEMEKYLEDNPSSPNYEYGDSYIEIAKGVLKRYLLRRSWDRIAEDSGFQLHADYLHLNSTGALMIAELITELIQRHIS
ncbi:MAG: hypothetical protein GF411_08360 [Candidatus Lokiarchaeota archaeon]|nr:hypothetical protein [Candidatus Lokiarchaeota archaeon]